MNCEIDGVKYVSEPDPTESCVGCVGEHNRALCVRLPECVREIYVIAPELTDDEILAICENFSNEFGVEQKELIPCIRAAIEADRAKR